MARLRRRIFYRRRCLDPPNVQRRHAAAAEVGHQAEVEQRQTEQLAPGHGQCSAERRGIESRVGLALWEGIDSMGLALVLLSFVVVQVWEHVFGMSYKLGKKCVAVFRSKHSAGLKVIFLKKMTNWPSRTAVILLFFLLHFDTFV